MLWWIILLAFGFPLIKYLFELYEEKKANNQKLDKIQKRLKEIEQRDAKKNDDGQ